MTEKELFEKFVSLELDSLALKEDVKQVKDEAKEIGFEKKAISLLQQSAKIHVANAFEERTEAQRELEDTYKRVTGYED
ncbi:hypothetical protein QGX11_gp054 [Pseudomonas phage PPSC2]|uniref:Uncharacterized protein n=1 Tax=Pseudomonas phage PPSC2 TaxID=2041350 RepID=A0A2R2YAR6_9CAUD|nr:hypothetical protein QGX11_gp054 [Pseudomonas phage PPSC2]ATN92817.1 hypothetical protein PPSC2_54 [Pseudomonas phage PPSC2]